MDELEKKILEDIQKTGFASELRVISKLLEEGWKTDHGETYEDKDENKSREIDIVAHKPAYHPQIAFRFNFTLVIEVKKSEQPWIVFTTDRKMQAAGWRVMHKARNDRKRTDPGSLFDIDCIRPSDPRAEKFRIGKAFHEAFKTNSDKSRIYGALIGASKAAHYFYHRFPVSFADFDVSAESELSIYLPIVVVDGRLFEVFNDYDGAIRVQEQGYLPVEMSYSSPHYRTGAWDAEFLPDIVTAAYFPDYLQALDAWRQSILERTSQRLKENGKLPNPKFTES